MAIVGRGPKMAPFARGPQSGGTEAGEQESRGAGKQGCMGQGMERSGAGKMIHLAEEKGITDMCFQVVSKVFPEVFPRCS